MQYNGIPASHGIAIGPAFLLKVEKLKHAKRLLSSDDEIAIEMERFSKAMIDVRYDLENIADSVGDVVEGRQIMEFLLLLLQDPTIKKEVEHRIRCEKVNAEYAVSTTLLGVMDKFSLMEDLYIRERIADVKDVGRRIIEKLTGTEKEVLKNLNKPVILIARDLDPSETAGLKPDQILAFVTDMGGRTSHTAILARGIGIPAVVGLRNISFYVNPQDIIIVDGIHGLVIVNPTSDELAYYKEVKSRFLAAEDLLTKSNPGAAFTEDGIRINLAANIELPHEVELVKKLSADGIGLFRTEFLKLMQENGEDEEEHFQIYKNIVEEISPNDTIIRTYDMGGDKFRIGSDYLQEANPFLGYRAIRVGLDKPHEFKIQLRAILRASAYGKIKLMFPMVTHIEQLQSIREILLDIQNDLIKKNISFDKDMPVGIMVETPATVIALDLMLPYIDFVSIGTNDLTQYTLAVDRGNPRVAELYDSFHPAVLRQIDTVVRLCHLSNKWVGLCGSMASDPLAIPLLIGLGIDEFSVAPLLIPDVKRMIGVVTTHAAREMIDKALMLETGLKIRSLVHSYVAGKYPDILLDENDWKIGG